MKLNLAATGLNPDNFPDGPFFISRQDSIYHSTTVNGKYINIYELRVMTATGRIKRCFVMCQELNPDMKAVLVVGLPSTSQSASADGSKELWINTPSVPNIEFKWPVHVVADQNCFAVVIDRAHGALDPAFEYPLSNPPSVLDPNGNPYPSDPYSPLIEDIACVEAARDFINNSPMLKLHPAAKGLRLPLIPQMLIGGLSWGSISASWLMAACPDFIAGYLAGMYINADWYRNSPVFGPGFAPAEWDLQSFNYKNLYQNSEAKEIMLTWGAQDDAYVNYDKTFVDSTVAILIAQNSNKYRKNISTSVVGHSIDLVHCRARFSEYFVKLTGTSWSAL